MKTDLLPRIVVLFVLFIAMSSPAVAQDDVILSADKDNTLYQSSIGSISNAIGNFLFVGKTAQNLTRRSVISFDVASGVPTGASIDSVQLIMNMNKTISGPHTISLHRMLADWGEGTSQATANEGAGATATTGDATWIHSFFSTANWASEGGDFDTDPSGSTSVNGNESYTWHSTAGMLSDVNSWLSAPDDNFGWMLKGDETVAGNAKRFASRENGNSLVTPRLRIFFTIVTDVESRAVPTTIRLASNFPNPFTSQTTIEYQITEAQHVVLEVFDSLGRVVARVEDTFKNVGEHRATFDSRGMSGGMYFYRIQGSKGVTFGNMLLVK